MTLDELKKIVREVVTGEFEPDFERGGGPQSEPDQSGILGGRQNDLAQQGDTSGILREPGIWHGEKQDEPHIWFDGGDNSRDASENKPLDESSEEYLTNAHREARNKIRKFFDNKYNIFLKDSLDKGMKQKAAHSIAERKFRMDPKVKEIVSYFREGGLTQNGLKKMGTGNNYDTFTFFHSNEVTDRSTKELEYIAEKI